MGYFDVGTLILDWLVALVRFWSTILNICKMCFLLTHLTQFVWYRHPYYCLIYVINVFNLYLSTENERFRHLERFLCDISLFVIFSVIFESPTKNDIKISVVGSLLWWYYALVVSVSWNIVEECSCKWVLVRYEGVFLMWNHRADSCHLFFVRKCML